MLLPLVCPRLHEKMTSDRFAIFTKLIAPKHFAVKAFFVIIVSNDYLGSTRIARIARIAKIDLRNPFFAIIDFDSQFLQSDQSEHSEQSERLGMQYWTLKVKNCNPSNPSRVFQSEQSESIIDFFSRL